ncbi:response regulator transcription factor [Nigerium massiliense]|uniref:response regulator transcription factor n=1 Tax=Nigerium massiliense TaxID=1522317 RepID=UPI001C438FFF|nr:helix-turn-helix transcriptional regulator [Nigerium massiliense]
MLELRVSRRVLVLPALTRESPRRRGTQVSDLFNTLSPRKRDIARLIADGHSNAEIAETLTIEPSSVRRNVSRILTKLDLRDRVQIAVLWHKAGL